jgi:hypothetical protein
MGVIKINQTLRYVRFGAVVLNDRNPRFAGRKAVLVLGRHLCKVFISVILHKLCSYLLTLPTQVSGILFKEKGSNETILLYPCSKEPVKMITMTL